MSTKSTNISTEDEQNKEITTQEQKDAPTFPTSLASAEAYEYARYHIDDEERLKENLKKLDEACEKGVDDSVITQLVCAVDTSSVMRFVRGQWDKLGKKEQFMMEKLLTPMPLQISNLGPVQIMEKVGFVRSKKHIVQGDEEQTEENIRKNGGLTRIAAEHGLKLGAYAAKLSNNPKLKFFAMAEPFIEPAARALDSLEKGAGNLRKAVLKNRAEWEKQQTEIEGISNQIHKQVASQVSNLRHLPKQKNAPEPPRLTA